MITLAQIRGRLRRPTLRRAPRRSAPVKSRVLRRPLGHQSGHPGARPQVLRKLPPVFDATEGSGHELAAMLKSPVAKAVEAVIPFGSTIAGIVSLFAPVLDTSLKASSCAPGSDRWPGCSLPSGGAAGLVAAGLSVEAARAIVERPPVGGGASPRMQRTLED